MIDSLAINYSLPSLLRLLCYRHNKAGPYRAHT